MISKEYRTQLQLKHEASPEWGDTGGRSFIALMSRVGEFYAKHERAPKVLDFGCGKGKLKEYFLDSQQSEILADGTIVEAEFKNMTFDEYDPGITGKDKIPMKEYDLIFCTDVLEHIETEFIHDNLKLIHELLESGGIGYFIIETRPAIHLLPDGRNAHISLLTPEAWESHFMDFEWSVKLAGTRDRMIVEVQK